MKSPLHNTILVTLGFLLITSCSPPGIDKDQIKNEIFETEKSFEKMVLEKGLYEGFTAFAADNAVLMRNDSIINGKEAIINYMAKGKENEGKYKLEWTPDFIEVAESGELAYTYGKYTLKLAENDSLIGKGIFHSIWKKQADGSWKYVWD